LKHVRSREVTVARDRFSLGQTVATPGALEAFARTGEEPLPFLAQHATGIWGELDDEDKAENDLAVQHGFRILSAYRLADDTRIWVITEADRSATTILLPEEY
jgi:hypothetical protein